MKLINKLLIKCNIIFNKFTSNEIVKHQAIVMEKNYKRIRFGDFIVMSTLFGIFTLIPIAIVKNIGYITLKTINNYDHNMIMFHNVNVFLFRIFNILDYQLFH